MNVVDLTEINPFVGCFEPVPVFDQIPFDNLIRDFPDAKMLTSKTLQWTLARIAYEMATNPSRCYANSNPTLHETSRYGELPAEYKSRRTPSGASTFCHPRCRVGHLKFSDQHPDLLLLHFGTAFTFDHLTVVYEPITTKAEADRIHA